MVSPVVAMALLGMLSMATFLHWNKIVPFVTKRKEKEK